MIHAPISQADRYISQHPLFPKAFAFLNKFERNTPNGRVDIEGENLFAVVQRYQPAPDKIWEAHRVYGDIQVLFEGTEACGVAATSQLHSLNPYVPEKDVEKFVAPNFPTSWITLRSGEFAVFYPEDAHQPGLQLPGMDNPVLKVVLKFRLL